MAAAAGGLSARKGGGAMSRDFGAESGTELLARLEGRTSLRELEPRLFAGEEGPAHGEILELHGPEGSGKTEMLYHLAARCLLPRAQGGLEAEALFVDGDGHFDLLRLVAVLEWRLGQGPQLKGQEGQGQEGPRRGQLLEGRGPGGSEAAVRTCLGRLRLLTCRSSTQLLLSLLALEARLCGAAPRLLLLDGLSAFYWLDRANGPGPAAQEAPLRACAQLLQRLARDHGLLLVATTQSLLPPRGAGDSDGAGDADGPRGARPYLCRAWQQAVGRSLLFSRPRGPAESFSILVRRPGGAPRRLAFRVGEGGLQFC